MDAKLEARLTRHITEHIVKILAYRGHYILTRFPHFRKFDDILVNGTSES
jgi:hypothetical protein